MRQLFLLIIGSMLSNNLTGQWVPANFLELTMADTTMRFDVRYFGSDNFVGQKVDGYEAEKIYLTDEAVAALKEAQKEFLTKDLRLKVFDGYRPQKAVDHFVKWATQKDDTLTKSNYYPTIDKGDLFELGYIASRSGHSRGSTVDVTLVYATTNKEVDMGSGWDFFGAISSHSDPTLSEEHLANRALLRETMEKHGFSAYSKEWWHYTLVNEPFPTTYFNFEIR